MKVSTRGDYASRALLSLVVIYALVPVVIKLITVTLVWNHPLTSRRHRAIRHRLARRS